MATVISMPSFTIFEEQDEEYKMSCSRTACRRVSLEAGATMGWWKYIGRDGIAIGLDRFGASAPAPLVQDKLGISASARGRRREEAGEEVAATGAREPWFRKWMSRKRG